MMASIIDEGVRRIISVGGKLDHMAGLDNFCWPDPVESEKTPDGQYKMAQLVRANKALYDVTTAYKVPCISGKDSMKNDSVRGGRKISIPPTVLFSTIGKIEDARHAVTMHFKKPGDVIYIVGSNASRIGRLRMVPFAGRRAGEGGCHWGRCATRRDRPGPRDVRRNGLCSRSTVAAFISYTNVRRTRCSCGLVYDRRKSRS